MIRKRIIFGPHSWDEMNKATALVQEVNRDMVSDTINLGVKRMQRPKGKRGFPVMQANRHWGKEDLRVVYEDCPWGCELMTILWEGHYD